MENNRLMVYGILKRGYELDLEAQGCKFLGECQLQGANLYGMNRLWDQGGRGRIWYGVGLRLVEDPRRVAHGELFEIPDELWPWLDGIEQNGFAYTRKIVQVVQKLESPEIGISMDNAWVYEHTFPGMRYDESNLIENGVF